MMAGRTLHSFTDPEVLACVETPGVGRVDDRETTITGTFAKAIMPVLPLEPSEIRTTLELLGMTPEDLRCAYCGDPPTEWDHFRATARAKRATGFGTTSRNLVPSCGKCNQSRGNKHWRTWIQGGAKLSPAKRRPDGLADRIERLARFEAWSEHSPLNYQVCVPPELLKEYWEQCDAIVVALQRAQLAADRVRAAIAAHNPGP